MNFLFFNFDDMVLWKLTTPQAWRDFIVVATASFMFLYIYYQVIVRNRSEAAAVDRVNRRIKRSAEKDARLYKNVGIRIGNKEIVVDNLLVDTHGILMGHTFGRGLAAYGEPKDEFWRITDNESSELVSNPLFEVDQMVHPIQTALAGHDIYGVHIEGAAIFADNFSDPELFLGQSANAFAIKNVKKYFEKRNQSKVSIKDSAKVAGALEKFFFEVQPKENHAQYKERVKREKREKRAALKAEKIRKA